MRIANLTWKIWILVVIVTMSLGIGLVSLSPTPSQPSHAQDGETSNDPLVVLNEDNIKQATVLIMQVSNRSGEPIISCVGSGTLVSTDGLILTNAHLVTPTDDCISDTLVIALTLRVDEPPIPTYTAEIVEISQGFDIAVLQITSHLDGRNIERGTLQLPFVELGDSNRVNLDDTIHIFGYPDIESEHVAVQRGSITGFTAEARVGERAWIRTIASIPGLMSGGGAYSLDGRLIGIPTVLPTQIAGTIVDCRQVYDTNNDNNINDNDGCIPIGGAITALRPSRLARGLVQAASLGIQVGLQRAEFEQPPIDDAPEFSNLFMATAINEAEMPISVVHSAPTGTNSLFLFFDYQNMVNGMVYELRTTINGRPDPNFSLPPVTWNGGQEGLWYIGSTGILWPVGTYEFTLFIEGRQADSLAFTIGGSPAATPRLSDLTFGIENPLGELVGANYVIPEGNIIRARFNYQNLFVGLNINYQWYLDGIPLAGEGGSGTFTWESEENQGTFNDLGISNEEGFISGIYRLELSFETEGGSLLAVLSDFIVAGGAGGANDAQAQIFSDFRFAQADKGTCH